MYKQKEVERIQASEGLPSEETLKRWAQQEEKLTTSQRAKERTHLGPSELVADNNRKHLQP